jgi:hypothetical protein
MKRYLIILMLSASPLFAGEQDPDIEAGRMIYDSFCASACHQAPAADRLTANQWRTVLKTMQTRMRSAGMPPLTEDEQRQLLAYLTRKH